MPPIASRTFVPDPRPDAGTPVVPTSDDSNPWQLARVGLAAVALGLVAYVGISAAQLADMGAPAAAPVADAPLPPAPYVAPPPASPTPETYASEPEKTEETTEE